MSDTPLACSLTPQQLRERRAYVRKTLVPRVCSGNAVDGGLDVYFEGAADLRALVEEFIELESSCCAFLDFGIVERGPRLLLTIRGPEAAADVLEMFKTGLTGGAR